MPVLDQLSRFNQYFTMIRTHEHTRDLVSPPPVSLPEGLKIFGSTSCAKPQISWALTPRPVNATGPGRIAAVRFYETLTGIIATPRRHVAPRASPSAGGADGHAIRIATIHLSNVNIDLLHHEGGPTDRAGADRSRFGGMHLCFEVDDLDSVFERMASVGLSLEGGDAVYEEDGPWSGPSGTSIAYFEDPDKVRLGLIHPVGSFRRFRGRAPS